ncbi:fumarylacetoacetate hydrolase family protein [Petroclostridium sp. X23]|uniref:fumarylacetoacetate hydrolase family protein n=1 Tax=Petroclostridium sp. X23 TaxID=3045146 RepID=UPI0024ADB7D6|nr:fumarylacetoacetate hydrolase family protein [Petroclostridium sp. X23]WHH58003.1 fumarylacetoacetate hydrolase family protein [Petroclostridium sp. X23]
MKLIRFLLNNQEFYGNLTDDKIYILSGSIEEGFTSTDHVICIEKVKLLSPVKPGKIVCVGLNYMDHIIESNEKVPSEPVIFMKPSTAVIGPDEGICYPVQSHRVDYEGELAIVIGKRGKNIKESEASSYILGYTCANDVTARDLQPSDGQWIIAKGFDTFLPLGPCIHTDVDPNNLPIRTVLNGKIVQSSNTKHLLFKPNMLISYISSVMTLEPGDIILTGTTFGIGPMQVDDIVSVEIDGIGKLQNFVEGLE